MKKILLMLICMIGFVANAQISKRYDYVTTFDSTGILETIKAESIDMVMTIEVDVKRKTIKQIISDDDGEINSDSMTITSPVIYYTDGVTHGDKYLCLINDDGEYSKIDVIFLDKHRVCYIYNHKLKRGQFLSYYKPTNREILNLLD